MSRKVEERCFMLLMILSTAGVVLSLLWILGTILWRSLPALSWEMLAQPPDGGYYLGGGGGILNAILGSLCLAGGGTLIALVLSIPIALHIQTYASRSRTVELVRLALDVLWGVPSIVYGVFVFILMLRLSMRASLLGGIFALVLLELPIMIRGMDEALNTVVSELKETSYALGATRWETATRVVLRQAAPALLTAALLAFGRGIGDAASVLFTAGFTDRLPESLLRPVASLPLAVFFQLNTPFPQVQERAYASALVLTVLVLLISLLSRLFARRLGTHVIR